MWCTASHMPAGFAGCLYQVDDGRAGYGISGEAVAVYVLLYQLLHVAAAIGLVISGGAAHR